MIPEHKVHDCCKQESNEIKIHRITNKTTDHKETNCFRKLKIKRGRHHHWHHDNIKN